MFIKFLLDGNTESAMLELDSLTPIKFILSSHRNYYQSTMIIFGAGTSCSILWPIIVQVKWQRSNTSYDHVGGGTGNQTQDPPTKSRRWSKCATAPSHACAFIDKLLFFVIAGNWEQHSNFRLHVRGYAMLLAEGEGERERQARDGKDSGGED